MRSYLVILASILSASALSWDSTKFLLVFGDSYTSTSFNITQGVNATDPGWVSHPIHRLISTLIRDVLQTASNGLNWVQYLRLTFNVNQDLKSWNLAVGGAVTDNNLVTPYMANIPWVFSSLLSSVQALRRKSLKVAG